MIHCCKVVKNIVILKLNLKSKVNWSFSHLELSIGIPY